MNLLFNVLHVDLFILKISLLLLNINMLRVRQILLVLTSFCQISVIIRINWKCDFELELQYRKVCYLIACSSFCRSLI